MSKVMLDVDEAASGSRVTLPFADSLRLRLAENPTTGYRWSVESSEGLQLEADGFTPAGQGSVAGAGGTRQLQWRATSTGEHSLALSLRREWEASGTAIRRFSLSVLSV